MPVSHNCGVPGCKHKGTITLPPIGPLRNEWYQLLRLDSNSQSHRICKIHFDPSDFGKSGKKLRRGDVKPTRHLPLHSVSLKKTTNTVFPILYLNTFSLLLLFISFLFQSFSFTIIFTDLSLFPYFLF